MIKHFFDYNESVEEDLGGGLKRRVLAHNDNLMAVEISFEKGAVGALHSHHHEQMTYILSGAFEFNVNGEKKILRAGDMTYKEPHVEHGAVCVEAGKLLDIFTPQRVDFL
ncbi:MAG: cupin domain-containing protein [Clostridium sp.]|nr:cupin domain-containing protein [Clostridium sp.]